MTQNELELNKRFEDPIKDRTVLLNNCSRAGLTAFPEMKESYDLLHPAYEPDLATIQTIRPLLSNHEITIVLGTWCSDSKIQVSNFLKVTDQLGIQERSIQLIAVNGAKEAENGVLDLLNITRVPTFIISKKGKELGRIIERPQTTLENDLLALLKR